MKHFRIRDKQRLFLLSGFAIILGFLSNAISTGILHYTGFEKSVGRQ